MKKKTGVVPNNKQKNSLIKFCQKKRIAAFMPYQK